MKLKPYIYISFFLIIVILAILSIPRIIKIGSIDCESQFGPCSDEINSVIQKEDGHNLRQTKQNLSRSLEKDRRVNEYDFKLSLPNSLTVLVVENKPSVALKRPGSQDYEFYSSDGVLVGSSDTNNLPVIINLKDDNIPEEQLIFAINMMEIVHKKYSVDTIEYHSDSIVMNYPDGVEVLFPHDGDLQILMGSYDLILSRLNTQSQNSTISKVDLRFDNPVIN